MIPASRALMTLAACALMGQAAPAPKPSAATAMWRLDCGRIDIRDLKQFSDTGRFDGRSYRLVDSCYLIRHGDAYLLWDTGLPKATVGTPVVENGDTMVSNTTIIAQLRQIGVDPARVRHVGISHYHDDHTGQVDDFPAATLLIGKGDWTAINSDRGRKNWPKLFASWRAGKAAIEQVDGDRDIYGDGSVIMLSLPGHTPGHHALLVNLPKTGPVLLSGDQFHLTDSLKYDQVPGFNTDRADTLASSARLREIAANRRAMIVIQHEPADVAKLPSFPKSAE